jgi:sulfatase maturation enzyme AslB (radical SAM superfamily)
MFDPRSKILANHKTVIDYLLGGNPAPVLVEVDPSNACNHGCYFCISSYIHLPESKNLKTFDRSIMPKSVLMKLCESLVKMGVLAVNWTGGGEPTVNPHLKEAITYIGQNSDVKMGMFTNGTLIDKFDLFETLVDNMTWVRFSIDSGTEETYNSVRRAPKGQRWSDMVSNLQKLIQVNKDKGNKIDIGVGFVITPDTYHEIVDFAKFFSKFDLAYCQFKPEIVNRERENGIQREVHFWKKKVDPLLKQAKEILGDKFQINGYKLNDLENDPEFFGRTYKKCIGSQLQPCVGADGKVYVCTNHRGYSEYSYGSLKENCFEEIWNDLSNRMTVMNQIEEKECFSNCTQLCKPHESNKILWEMYENVGDQEYLSKVVKEGDELSAKISHKEFI